MIYLASTSPRRKRLLKDAGVRYRTLRPNYHERPIAGLAPPELVKRHALEKGLSAAKLVKSGIILSADTIVYVAGGVIGKPKNRGDAFGILSKLQGRWHTVYTGVALLKVSGGSVVKRKSFYAKTRVFVRPMSAGEIKSYFKKINPLDKAGAYAIQSCDSSVVEKIRGSFSNAVGLPMEALQRIFKTEF